MAADAVTKGYDAIFYSVCDLHGVMRGRFVFSPVAEKMVRKGMAITQAVVVLGILSDVPEGLTDFEEVGWSNGLCIPDPATLKPMSWVSDHKIGHMICDLKGTQGEPEPSSPRHVLKQQVEQLMHAGYSLQVAQHLEFTICSKGSQVPLEDREKVQVVINKLKNILHQDGIPLIGIEMASNPWNLRISLPCQDALAAADTAHRLHYVIKSVCDHADCVATFMTFPFSGQSDSSYTLNYCLQSLDSGRNVFTEESSSGNASALISGWLSGQKKHGASVYAFLRPTVNCYHCPVESQLTKRAVRIVENSKDQGLMSLCVEDSRPSSASNPYLVLTAIIASGIDGLSKCKQSTSANADNYMLESPQPPTCLQTALDKLEANEHITMTVGEAITKHFIKLKRDWEVGRFQEMDFKSDRDQEEFSRKIYFDSL